MLGQARAQGLTQCHPLAWHKVSGAKVAANFAATLAEVPLPPGISLYERSGIPGEDPKKLTRAGLSTTRGLQLPCSWHGLKMREAGKTPFCSTLPRVRCPGLSELKPCRYKTLSPRVRAVSP